MGEPSRPSRAPWALAFAAVAVVAIVTAGAVFVFHSARSLPGEVMEGGRQALRDLREVAAAFRTGTVTTRFHGYATEVSGRTRLQFGELRQVEVFERRDGEAVLWVLWRCPTWWWRPGRRSPTPTTSTSTRSGASASRVATSS